MILEIKYLCNVEIIMVSSQKGTIFQNIFGDTVCRQIQITEHFLRFRNGQLERWWDLKDTDWNQPQLMDNTSGKPVGRVTKTIAPENGWLEVEISFWEGLFSGAFLVWGMVSKDSW